MDNYSTELIIREPEENVDITLMDDNILLTAEAVFDSKNFESKVFTKLVQMSGIFAESILHEISKTIFQLLIPFNRTSSFLTLMQRGLNTVFLLAKGPVPGSTESSEDSCSPCAHCC